MGEEVVYDESRGYLVFVIGEKDPIPYRPQGWNGVDYPLNLVRNTAIPKDRKLGVGIDAMGVDSRRRILVLFNPEMWVATDYKAGVMDHSQEVFRNSQMVVHLDAVVGV